jgi:hypothetical protein
MAKQLLSPGEIEELVSLLKEVFAYISDLKERNPIAADIQYPKLPPKLTESLAIHMLRTGLIPDLRGRVFSFGGNEADIIGEGQGRRARIEVKGTTKGFEYFGEKDIRADYLLWFDFEDLFRNGKKSFTLCVLPHDQTRFSAPVKITLSGLRKVAGDLQWTSYDIEDLLERLKNQAR